MSTHWVLVRLCHHLSSSRHLSFHLLLQTQAPLLQVRLRLWLQLSVHRTHG
jgi:hypothetical protein